MERIDVALSNIWALEINLRIIYGQKTIQVNLLNGSNTIDKKTIINMAAI